MENFSQENSTIMLNNWPKEPLEIKIKYDRETFIIQMAMKLFQNVNFESGLKNPVVEANLALQRATVLANILNINE